MPAARGLAALCVVAQSLARKPAVYSPGSVSIFPNPLVRAKNSPICF
jgi:hypothetical protein